MAGVPGGDDKKGVLDDMLSALKSGDTFPRESRRKNRPARDEVDEDTCTFGEDRQARGGGA